MTEQVNVEVLGVGERFAALLEGLPEDIFDRTTVSSLLLTVLLLSVAYMASLRLLNTHTPSSHRILFVWHAWDALIHFVLEGSYLYNCFFTFVGYDSAVSHPVALTNFLGRPDRLYGSAYGDNPFARLWQVYARADFRWGGADPTVISLELLTVFGGGPLAVAVCWMLVKRNPMVNFWMVVLAIGELYGGFITFCPEWLTGNVNLDTSNFMYLYVYLVFFNGLWVVFPIYAIHVAYTDMKNAFMVRNGVVVASLSKQRKDDKKNK